MKGSDYQSACQPFDNHRGGYKGIAAALGLVAEAGEVANLYERSLRETGSGTVDRHELMLELGDVLWNVARIASMNVLDLDVIMQANLDKLTERYARDGIELRRD